MRLMIVIFTLTFLVILDHYKYNGYYVSQLSQYVARTMRSVM